MSKKVSERQLAEETYNKVKEYSFVNLLKNPFAKKFFFNWFDNYDQQLGFVVDADNQKLNSIDPWHTLASIHSDEIIDECMHNIYYFLTRVLMIKKRNIVSGGKIISGNPEWFHINRANASVIQASEAGADVIWEAPKQVGKDTFICSYCFWLSKFTNAQIKIQCDNPALRAHLTTMMNTMFIPSWMESKLREIIPISHKDVTFIIDYKIMNDYDDSFPSFDAGKGRKIFIFSPYQSESYKTHTKELAANSLSVSLNDLNAINICYEKGIPAFVKYPLDEIYEDLYGDEAEGYFHELCNSLQLTKEQIDTDLLLR